MDVPYLSETVFIRSSNLEDMVETTWSEQCLIEVLGTIGCADDADVVELGDTIKICEELSNDLVSGTTIDLSMLASLWAKGVDLINDDDVEWTVNTKVLPVLDGRLEELLHILSTLTDESGKHFGALDDLKVSTERVAHLSCDQRLTSTWRPIHYESLREIDIKLLFELAWEHPGQDEGLEDFDEEGVLASDAHLLE